VEVRSPGKKSGAGAGAGHGERGKGADLHSSGADPTDPDLSQKKEKGGIRSSLKKERGGKIAIPNVAAALGIRRKGILHLLFFDPKGPRSRNRMSPFIWKREAVVPVLFSRQRPGRRNNSPCAEKRGIPACFISLGETKKGNVRKRLETLCSRRAKRKKKGGRGFLYFIRRKKKPRRKKGISR